MKITWSKPERVTPDDFIELSDALSAYEMRVAQARR